MGDIEKILQFIVEVEKLKGVLRKTRPVGFGRYENSAEHSWHVCLLALMLKDYAHESVNIDRVIRMLLIHDVGEIDAGDTIVYASENSDVTDRERAGIKRIFNMLPAQQTQEYETLWEEFEAGESPDAVFAKAIDRVPPLLHNLYGEGHSWRDNGVSVEQVLQVNSRIACANDQLWLTLKQKIDVAKSDGLFGTEPNKGEDQP